MQKEACTMCKPLFIYTEYNWQSESATYTLFTNHTRNPSWHSPYNTLCFFLKQRPNLLHYFDIRDCTISLYNEITEHPTLLTSLHSCFWIPGILHKISCQSLLSTKE